MEVYPSANKHLKKKIRQITCVNASKTKTKQRKSAIPECREFDGWKIFSRSPSKLSQNQNLVIYTFSSSCSQQLLSKINYVDL